MYSSFVTSITDDLVIRAIRAINLAATASVGKIIAATLPYQWMAAILDLLQNLHQDQPVKFGIARNPPLSKATLLILVRVCPTGTPAGMQLNCHAHTAQHQLDSG